jgi:8-oxo-dGTP diphosphatase
MTRAIAVAAAVICREGEILVTQRHVAADQGGLWEFPGGKLEPGESAEQALSRELQEELGITVLQRRPFLTLSYDYPEYAVCLQIFIVDAFSGEPEAREGQPMRWLPPAALLDLRFPAANQPIVEKLQQISLAAAAE